MIRAVTFDCWGTLLTDRDFARATSTRVNALLEHAGGKLSFEQASELLDRAWKTHYDQWVAGCHYGAEGMADFCVSELGSPREMAAALCAAFEDAAAEGDVEPLPGAVETLRGLREAGLRTALVCDTGFTPGRMVRRFLAELGLDEHLEFLAFSNEVGVPKPHERMFRTALDAIGVAPEDAVHVGDLRRTDIAGAQAAGMRAIRIRAVTDDVNPQYPEADEIVDDHRQIPAALVRLGAELPGV
ncbi:MAG TPA: HAD family hydrolase [Actinomycetota bacterium]|nr:HAD family hydrolase [Actinomycetota bacterium]